MLTQKEIKAAEDQCTAQLLGLLEQPKRQTQPPDLRPCPCCRGKAALSMKPDGFGHVECKECGLRTRLSVLPVDLWNAHPAAKLPKGTHELTVFFVFDGHDVEPISYDLNNETPPLRLHERITADTHAVNLVRAICVEK